MAQSITVGINSLHYNEERNFVSLPFEQVTFRRVRDGLTVPRHLLYRAFRRRHQGAAHRALQLFQNAHWDPRGGGHLMHFFNSVSASPIPWVVTFETAVPRWNPRSAWGMKLLAGSACKRLIALSQCAYDIQHSHLREFPNLQETIERKMEVIHPAQRLLVEGYDKKVLAGDLLDFTMVGAAFFRKGGMEVLRAFDTLLGRGLPIRLNVVSRMEHDHVPHSTEEDRRRAMEIIRRHPERIRYVAQLPNAEVLDLLRRSHVALLPTSADTYGYSVLESQASGCPVITTNIRALPEINNDRVGWLIDVPRTSLGYAQLDTRAQQQEVSELILEGVTSAIEEICNNPSVVRKKGELCLQRIRTHHDPHRQAARLEAIYRAALK